MTFFFFYFLGVLLGIAIRTGSPLSLNLAEPVWKQLAGMNLTIADLSEASIYLLSLIRIVMTSRNQADSDLIIIAAIVYPSQGFTVQSCPLEHVQGMSKYKHVHSN